MTEMRKQTAAHWRIGYPKHYTHFLGDLQRAYFKQLSKEAGIENIPDVIVDIYMDSINRAVKDLAELRNFRYTIRGKSFTKVNDVYKPPISSS